MPGFHATQNRLVGTHLRAIADTRPDLEAARRFGERLDMEIRYVGEGESWTTSESVPAPEDVAERSPHDRWDRVRAVLHPRWTPGYVSYLAETPHGRYVFAQRLDPGLGRAHDRMLLLILVLMAAVFAAAYLVLRRALGPLRLLRQGVTELREGRLDVVVPKRSADEFGALTDAFNRMARRVRDMVRSRERLLIDVSHELRSPLTRMKVELEMLPDGDRKRSMAADLAEMEAMVAGLLELHRADDATRRERVDPAGLAAEVVERYRDRPPGVRLVGTPPSLHLDLEVERVRTVFRNVIENALKFSLPDSLPVEIAVAADEGAAVVRVVDDGAGIPEGDDDRLFEPFFRPDPSRSKRTGGYGLGLGICKRIMEGHGGTITIERNPGRGVTVVLRFPAPDPGTG